MPQVMPKGIQYQVSKVIRDQGPISRAQIARMLSLSPTTTGRLVDGLLQSGILCEIGQMQGEGAGRPSRMVMFNSQFSSVLTVDLRLTDAYAAVADLNGHLLRAASRSLTTGEIPQSLVELVELVGGLLQSTGGCAPVEMIVVGAPSIVDSASGVIEWAPSLGWENVPLQAILEDEFKLPVLIENDVNLAALGEWWQGVGKSAAGNLVFVSLGTGIGAGIVLNGELFRGATNASGEVAYFITDVAILRDEAGRIGSLENRVGHDGLIRMAQLVAQRYPTSGLADLMRLEADRADPRRIIELALAGDQAARVVFNEMTDILTIVIANLAVALDPEVIVLGGARDWNWPALVEAIQRRIGTKLLRPVNLCPSDLQNDALILGGVYCALQHLRIFNNKEYAWQS
jgi:predicted NBD/HSP70 family sugar kinase